MAVISRIIEQLVGGKVLEFKKPREILKAIGDCENIKSIDACITRLRLELYDSSLVDKEKLKTLGALGVIDSGENSVQIVFGIEAEVLKAEIKAIIEAEEIKKEDSVLKSPLKGKLLDIIDVPDEVFAEKLLGDGIAIEPSEGILYSPVDGEVVQLFSTKHAVEMLSNDGLEILIHIGIDTVKMNGEGFKNFVSQGDKVKIGDKLIEFDLNLIKQKAKSTITPVLITNLRDIKELKLLTQNNVKVKQDLIIIKK